MSCQYATQAQFLELEEKVERLTEALYSKSPSIPTQDGDLLPCPLCGSPAEDYRVMESVHRVACSICDLETANYKTQEEARVHWNRRAPHVFQKRAPIESAA